MVSAAVAVTARRTRGLAFRSVFCRPAIVRRLFRLRTILLVTVV
jgi:hypothetical protein